MKKSELPHTDSINELARFWDSHDLTDFADELEEVTEPVFEREAETVSLHLDSGEIKVVQEIARRRGVGQSELLREWVLEKLAALRS